MTHTSASEERAAGKESGAGAPMQAPATRYTQSRNAPRRPAGAFAFGTCGSIRTSPATPGRTF